MPPCMHARLAVVVGYLAVALAFSWPLPAALGSAFTGDAGGDTGVYVWNQWVFQHEAFVQGRNPFTTGQILSLTERVNLSQHNYTTFLNLLALPLMPVFGVVATFNIVYLATTVLTAVCTYLLARRVAGVSRMEAWLAGLLFSWSPVLVARSTGHFSLVAAAPLPAFLLALIRAERSRRPRDAALAGISMAWAAMCDVYYGVYCLLIAAFYLAAHVIAAQRQPRHTRVPFVWMLDVGLVCVTGLIVGLLLGGGGRVNIAGIPVSIHRLYTPVLILTVLIGARIALWWRPRVLARWSWSPSVARAVVIGVLACAGPLAPVLYGVGERLADGSYVSPATLWRSSPRGVDLLSWFIPNPNHPLVRRFIEDQQARDVSTLCEYTAAVSLVALGVIVAAVWRAGYRPRFGWLALTAGFALLALGPFVIANGVNTYVPGPWSILRYVPLVGSARTPTRFAVVASLGLAILFASALAALGRRYPGRRPLITAVVAVLLVFELCPAPRTLYSAEIPSVFHIIASDPRPVRVLQLPIGVKDGVSSTGEFSARSQYFQTLHHKRLIGGYLSRISPRRVERLRREHPTVDLLITLSEGRELTPEQAARARERLPGFLARANVGWVVIDYAEAPPGLVHEVLTRFPLEEVARDGVLVLYRPRAVGPP